MRWAVPGVCRVAHSILQCAFHQHAFPFPANTHATTRRTAPTHARSVPCLSPSTLSHPSPTACSAGMHNLRKETVAETGCHIGWENRHSLLDGQRTFPLDRQANVQKHSQGRRRHQSSVSDQAELLHQSESHAVQRIPREA